MISKLTRIVIIGFLFFIYSCNDKISDDFETYTLDYESKQWLFSGNEGDIITMEDSLNNRISITYKYDNTSYIEAKMLTDWFGWFYVVYAEYESISQFFSFNNGIESYTELKAKEPPENCELTISFESSTDLTVSIYPKSLKINEVKLSKQVDNNNGLAIGSGVRNDRDRVNSKLTHHESIIINDKVYSDVLEFELRDLLEYTDTLTVMSFSIGKEVGLLNFRLMNDQYFERVEK